LGYAGWKLREFIRFLKRQEIEVLVDVRLFPTSKKPEVMKKNL
jgi:uncharacterized protein (DUF488 family)